MFLKAVTRGEGLEAEGTLVWPLPGVAADVEFEAVFVHEAFVALGTLEWLDLGVYLEVTD